MVWLNFASRKEIYGMASTFENEAIHYCFLNAHQHLALKNHKENKPEPFAFV